MLFFQNLCLCFFVKSLICSPLCEQSFCLFLHWKNLICAFLHNCALFWRNKSLGYLCSMRRSVLFPFIFQRNGDYVLLPEDEPQSLKKNHLSQKRSYLWFVFKNDVRRRVLFVFFCQKSLILFVLFSEEESYLTPVNPSSQGVESCK